MNMSNEEGRLLLEVGNLILAVSVGLYAWLKRRHTANAKAIKELGETMVDMDKRLTRIETKIEHIPTAEQLAMVDRQAAEHGARLNSLGNELRAIHTAITRVQDFLLGTSK